jgi:siroheme synthase-like protein
MPNQYYPVFLDLRGKRCVVIGGGEIGERKVQGLLGGSAKVTLISPEITQGLQALALAGRIEWLAREYREGDLRDAFLAIAATDKRGVNQAIATEAEREKVVLNVVDDAPLCTFIAPSIVRRGEVTLAISTGGSSPALARKLKETILESDLLRYADLAEVLSKARTLVKQRGLVVDAERWQEGITEQLVGLVDAGKSEEALDVLISFLLGESEGAVEVEAVSQAGPPQR